MKKFRVEKIGSDLCIEFEPKPDQHTPQYAKALMLFSCGHFCYRGNGDPPACCNCVHTAKPDQKRRASCSVCLNKKLAPDIFQSYTYDDTAK